jgi:uncharacterized protein YggE
MRPTVTILCVYSIAFVAVAAVFSTFWAVRALTLLAAGLRSRARDARRAERQAAERVAEYVASLTPEEVAEILSGPHWRQS